MLVQERYKSDFESFYGDSKLSEKLAIPPRLERGTYCLEGVYWSLGKLRSNTSVGIHLIPSRIFYFWYRAGTASAVFHACPCPSDARLSSG
jgi:hypothetical protein